MIFTSEILQSQLVGGIDGRAEWKDIVLGRMIILKWELKLLYFEYR
jgi:hypothetical protein